MFGERNTGTNFLNELLRQNTCSIVLENSSNAQAKARLARLRGLDKTAREFAIERLIDLERRKNFLMDYGWKHANVAVKALQMSPRFSETAFLFLIRNPFKFILSMYKRPYNLFPKPSGSMGEFIASPLIANVRDGLMDDYLESPVDLWNKKVASYYRALKMLPGQSISIFYEKLVDSPGQELARLKLLGVNLVEEPYKIPSQSTKGDALTFEDYRLQSSMFNPLDHMNREEAVAIASRLNGDLVAATPYESLVKDFLMPSMCLGLDE